jgi:diguanylate cyclase
MKSKIKKPYVSNHEKYVRHLKTQTNLNPALASFKIIMIYLIVGFLWIFLSDEALAVFADNPDLFRELQLYKGWFYVFASAGIFYWIIFNQMKLYVKQIEGLDLAYIELEKVHQELLYYERQMHDVAYYDDLTKLPSKAMLVKTVAKIISSHHKNNKKFAYIYFDIDDFRHVNEMYGYQAGDQLLKDVAHILSEHIKEPNLVSRLGEDKFVILCVDCETQQGVTSKIDEIVHELSDEFEVESEDFSISLSVGVALYPDHGNDFMSLMRSADTALLFAKTSGKKQAIFFEESMHTHRTKQIEILQNIKQAINNQDFTLNYQPIYNIKNNSVVGVEALIRWQHETKGFISPLDFIPIAEVSGQIHEINDFVFKKAFSKYHDWKKSGLENIDISINVSAKSLNSALFINQLKELCLDKNNECSLFTLEITETAMIDDLEKTEQTLIELKKMGLSIALDDFGTGFSSLTYLKKLPIDIIKIDRLFISECIEKTSDEDTLKYIIDLAHHLKMRVVAEGIETQEQLDLLKSLNCDFAQGYHLGRPMTAEKVEEHIKKNLQI